MYQTNAPWSFGQLTTLEGQINRHSAIVHWYAQWGNQSGVYSPTVANLLAAVRAHGSTPLITWEPWDQPPATNNPFPLTQISAGAFDTYIDSWASGLATYGHPVLLSFAHEMNGNWYPWGANINGNTAVAYIAAYRHVHDRFALKGARNVQWVFNVGGDPYGSFPDLRTFYPGDAYADWLATDVYNFGTTQSWSSWQPLSFLLKLDYARLAALNASKPLMLAEWASAEQGGSKSAWIADAAATLSSQFPRVRAAVWFSRNGTGLELDSSASALGAARAAFGAAPYCLTLPY
jgi:beta-mannanase